MSFGREQRERERERTTKPPQPRRLKIFSLVVEELAALDAGASDTNVLLDRYKAGGSPAEGILRHATTGAGEEMYETRLTALRLLHTLSSKASSFDFELPVSAVPSLLNVSTGANAAMRFARASDLLPCLTCHTDLRMCSPTFEHRLSLPPYPTRQRRANDQRPSTRG